MKRSDICEEVSSGNENSMEKLCVRIPDELVNIYPSSTHHHHNNYTWFDSLFFSAEVSLRIAIPTKSLWKKTCLLLFIFLGVRGPPIFSLYHGKDYHRKESFIFQIFKKNEIESRIKRLEKEYEDYENREDLEEEVKRLKKKNRSLKSRIKILTAKLTQKEEEHDGETEVEEDRETEVEEDRETEVEEDDDDDEEEGEGEDKKLESIWKIYDRLENDEILVLLIRIRNDKGHDDRYSSCFLFPHQHQKICPVFNVVKCLWKQGFIESFDPHGVPILKDNGQYEAGKPIQKSIFGFDIDYTKKVEVQKKIKTKSENFGIWFKKELEKVYIDLPEGCNRYGIRRDDFCRAAFSRGGAIGICQLLMGQDYGSAAIKSYVRPSRGSGTMITNVVLGLKAEIESIQTGASLDYFRTLISLLEYIESVSMVMYRGKETGITFHNPKNKKAKKKDDVDHMIISSRPKRRRRRKRFQKPQLLRRLKNLQTSDLTKCGLKQISSFDRTKWVRKFLKKWNEEDFLTYSQSFDFKRELKVIERLRDIPTTTRFRIKYLKSCLHEDYSVRILNDKYRIRKGSFENLSIVSEYNQLSENVQIEQPVNEEYKEQIVRSYSIRFRLVRPVDYLRCQKFCNIYFPRNTVHLKENEHTKDVEVLKMFRGKFFKSDGSELKEGRGRNKKGNWVSMVRDCLRSTETRRKVVEALIATKLRVLDNSPRTFQLDAKVLSCNNSCCEVCVVGNTTLFIGSSIFLRNRKKGQERIVWGCDILDDNLVRVYIHEDEERVSYVNSLDVFLQRGTFRRFDFLKFLKDDDVRLKEIIERIKDDLPSLDEWNLTRIPERRISVSELTNWGLLEWMPCYETSFLFSFNEVDFNSEIIFPWNDYGMFPKNLGVRYDEVCGRDITTFEMNLEHFDSKMYWKQSVVDFGDTEVEYGTFTYLTKKTIGSGVTSRTSKKERLSLKKSILGIFWFLKEKLRLRCFRCSVCEIQCTYNRNLDCCDQCKDSNRERYCGKSRDIEMKIASFLNDERIPLTDAEKKDRIRLLINVKHGYNKMHLNISSEEEEEEEIEDNNFRIVTDNQEEDVGLNEVEQERYVHQLFNASDSSQSAQSSQESSQASSQGSSQGSFGLPDGMDMDDLDEVM